uniref:SERTA domain-containing protein n=1 Tax=Syphacia muris TaxID=451379 RepID=A0A0N5B0Z0_9BILA
MEVSRREESRWREMEDQCRRRRRRSTRTEKKTKLCEIQKVLAVNGVATYFRVLDVVHRYMPHCQKKVNGREVKLSESQQQYYDGDDDIINESSRNCEYSSSSSSSTNSASSTSSNTNSCSSSSSDNSCNHRIQYQRITVATASDDDGDESPKMMKSRFFCFQRPGCSSDDFAPLAATIYLSDGEQMLPNNCQLFAKDDGSPPPNCNPFDSAATFKCFPFLKERDPGNDLLDYTYDPNISGPIRYPERPYFWSDKHFSATDCRKLANGCFSSGSRWSSCGTQQKMPNPVVYVPRRYSNSNNMSTKTSSRNILQQKSNHCLPGNCKNLSSTSTTAMVPAAAEATTTAQAAATTAVQASELTSQSNHYPKRLLNTSNFFAVNGNSSISDYAHSTVFPLIELSDSQA